MTTMGDSSDDPDSIEKRMELQHLQNQKEEATFTMIFVERLSGTVEKTQT